MPHSTAQQSDDQVRTGAIFVLDQNIIIISQISEVVLVKKKKKQGPCTETHRIIRKRKGNVKHAKNK